MRIKEVEGESKNKDLFPMSLDLTQYFDSPDELADFCMMDVEGQAAKLQEIAAQGRITGRMQCAMQEVAQ